MSDQETREHRSDAETPEQRAQRAVVEVTEEHVGAVEQAANRGQLSRRQAERVVVAGQKGLRSHDMSRGVRRL